jgi:hypothetical protein
MDRYLPVLVDAREIIESVTREVIARAKDNPDEVGAASYAYMELLGLVLYSFMWQRILASALQQRNDGSGDQQHLGGLIKTGDFFFARLWPKHKSLVAEIQAGAESLMALSAEEF